MPGGTRAGREGICGGAGKGSLLAAKTLWGPGRRGMGGAAKGPPAGMGSSGGPGVGPLTAGGRPGGRTAEMGRRCGGGLWGEGGVRTAHIHSCGVGGGYGVRTAHIHNYGGGIWGQNCTDT